jgi:hypothetical protein
MYRRDFMPTIKEFIFSILSGPMGCSSDTDENASPPATGADAGTGSGGTPPADAAVSGTAHDVPVISEPADISFPPPLAPDAADAAEAGDAFDAGAPSLMDSAVDEMLFQSNYAEAIATPVDGIAACRFISRPEQLTLSKITRGGVGLETFRLGYFITNVAAGDQLTFSTYVVGNGGPRPVEFNCTVGSVNRVNPLSQNYGLTESAIACDGNLLSGAATLAAEFRALDAAHEEVRNILRVSWSPQAGLACRMQYENSERSGGAE